MSDGENIDINEDLLRHFFIEGFDVAWGARDLWGGGGDGDKAWSLVDGDGLEIRLGEVSVILAESDLVELIFYLTPKVDGIKWVDFASAFACHLILLASKVDDFLVIIACIIALACDEAILLAVLGKYDIGIARGYARGGGLMYEKSLGF